MTKILKIIPTNNPIHALKKVMNKAIKSADAISVDFLAIDIAMYAQAKPVRTKVNDKAICINGFIKVMTGSTKYKKGIPIK